MKIQVRDYKKQGQVVHTNVICTGVRDIDINNAFIGKFIKIFAEHFSINKNSIDIIIYNNDIKKHDDTDESINSFRSMSMKIRDKFLEAGIHSDACEYGFKEWDFPKARKRTPETKMALHIKVHNHKVLRSSLVDKHVYEDGALVRSDFATTEDIINAIHASLQTCTHDVELCRNREDDGEYNEDRDFKFIQVKSLIDQATMILNTLNCNG